MRGRLRAVADGIGTGVCSGLFAGAVASLFRERWGLAAACAGAFALLYPVYTWWRVKQARRE